MALEDFLNFASPKTSINADFSKKIQSTKSSTYAPTTTTTSTYAPTTTTTSTYAPQYAYSYAPQVAYYSPNTSQASSSKKELTAGASGESSPYIQPSATSTPTISPTTSPTFTAPSSQTGGTPSAGGFDMNFLILIAAAAALIIVLK